MSRLPLLAVWFAVFVLAGCCCPGSELLFANDDSPVVPLAPPPAPDAGAVDAGPSEAELAHVHPVFKERRGFLRSPARLLEDKTWVPQLPNLSEAFEAMPKKSGPGPADALVVCRLGLKARFDEFAGPDVSARFEAGGRRYDQRAFDDSMESYFSLPHATWPAGGLVSYEAWDRDVTGTEDIGKAEAKAGTLPLVLSHQWFDLECRAWPAGQVEQKAKALDAALAKDTARARSKLRPRPGAPGWGLRESGLEALWSEVDHLAGLVGFEDERFRAAGAALVKLQADWSEAITRSVAAEAAKLPPLSKTGTLRLPDVEVTVSQECDPARIAAIPVEEGRELPGSGCVLRVDAVRTAPEGSLFLFPEKHVEARFVLPDGSETGGSFLAMVDAQGKATGFQWAPAFRERYTVYLAPGSEAAGARPKAVLLRFERPRADGTCALVRLDG